MTHHESLLRVSESLICVNYLWTICFCVYFIAYRKKVYLVSFTLGLKTRLVKYIV